MKIKAPSKAVLEQQARVEALASSTAEWGVESHGYTLQIHDQAGPFSANLFPSVYVIDVECDESAAPTFVGIALIDVRGGSKIVHYFSRLSEDLRNLLNKSQFIGHNVKADLHWLNGWGCSISGNQIYADTMIMAYCEDTTNEAYGLKALADKCLSWRYPTYRDIVGKGAKKVTLDRHEIALVGAYCATDAAATFGLYSYFAARLGKESKYYHGIEFPLYRLLFDIERKGAYLDTTYLAGLNTSLLVERDGLLSALHGFCGSEFNPASPKQVKEKLFAKLGIREEKTDVTVLKRHAKIPEIGTLLKFREVSKLASTYTGAFLALPTLPRVHARFNQVSVSSGSVEATKGIRTGRLSSSEPNLQNIPTRTEAGAKIRRAFIAPPGHVLLAADYSQVEYRLLAHFSAEPKLIEAFNKGADVHEETGKALGVDRALGKTLNFAAIYGAGPKKIAFTAGITVEDAEEFLAAYWKNLPGVRKWINSTHAKAYHFGGVSTMLGRFIPLPGLKSNDQYERWYNERAAVNYIVQGSAAEVIKLAMLRLQALGLIPSLTVHDELVFEVKDDAALIAATKAKIESTMANVVRLKVPLLVEAGVGKDWWEAKHENIK